MAAPYYYIEKEPVPPGGYGLFLLLGFRMFARACGALRRHPLLRAHGTVQSYGATLAPVNPHAVNAGPVSDRRVREAAHPRSSHRPMVMPIMMMSAEHSKVNARMSRAMLTSR